MKRPPTDLELLEEIYRRYYPAFVDPKRIEANPRTKVFVPIDCRALADHFGVDLDIVFGRLYYHLNQKYGYKDDQGVSVSLFCMQVANLRHAIQFPLLASITADLRDQRDQYLWTLWLSIIATVLSVLAFGISIFEKL